MNIKKTSTCSFARDIRIDVMSNRSHFASGASRHFRDIPTKQYKKRVR